jgi:phage I-like protein
MTALGVALPCASQAHGHPGANAPVNGGGGGAHSRLMTKHTASSAFAIALNTATGSAPDWVQLLPAGPAITGRDGRAWTMADVGTVLAATQAAGPLHIDFEHASETVARTGQEAPAAGWFDAFEARDGALWGKVSWTAKAANMIAAREYRFLSPVFYFDVAKNVVSLVSAGLTNRPNLDLTALNRQQDPMTKRALNFNPNHGGDGKFASGAGGGAKVEKVSSKTEAGTPDEAEVHDKNMREMAKRAGIDADKLLKDGHDEDLIRELYHSDKLGGDADMEQLEAAAEDYGIEWPPAKPKAKNTADRPALEKYVPRADYDVMRQRADRAELALNRIETERHTSAVNAAIDGAVAAGKIAPASRGFYVASCQDQGGLQRFQAFVAGSPVLTAPSSVGGAAPVPAGGALTADEKAMCANMDLDEALYAKNR